MSLFDDLPPPEDPRPAKPRREAPAPARERRPRTARAAAPPPAAEPREAAPPGPEVISVGALTAEVARRLSALGRVAVEGEVQGLKRAGSGHVYFALKDEQANLACVIWRSRVAGAARFRLEEGMRVVAHGALDVYKPRGSYSLVVDRVEQRGVGELLARLERLKQELSARGWFERARPLPPMPRVVGVVTSRDSDAFQDILRTRSLRWPGYPLRLCHTRVQGSGAADEVAQAIGRLDASGVDVICVVRGGGSLEDLWSFNELVVAEAVWGASVPVVSGVGHQSDVTLCDLVADHRAHTPTDAAQTVLPERARLEGELERRAAWLAEALDRQLSARAERLASLAQRRVLRDATGVLAPRAERLDGAARRLRLALGSRLDGARGELARWAERLAGQSPGVRLERLEGRLAPLAPRLAAGAREALERRAGRLSVSAKGLASTSPFAVLARGYSITRTADGRAVRAADELRAGEVLETLFHAGRARSTVDEVDSEGGAGPVEPLGDEP